jgi:hypothetical protein
MGYLYDACDQISDLCHQQLLRKMRRKISWTEGRTEVKQYAPLPLRGAGLLKGKCFQTYALCYLMADNAKNPFVHLVSCFFFTYIINSQQHIFSL